jgi:hypothetical protein
MCSYPCYDCIPMQRISDQAAVEILNFLQMFTTDFEIRYGRQIQCYYDDRAQHNIVQSMPQTKTDDPPF